MVDFVKRAYRGEMRAFDGSTFLVDWVKVPDDRPVLEGPTPFRSGRNDPYAPFDMGWIGEIPEFRPVRSRAKLPARVCHSCRVGYLTWWENGWPVGTPPVVLAPDGFAVGCDPNKKNVFRKSHPCTCSSLATVVNNGYHLVAFPCTCSDIETVVSDGEHVVSEPCTCTFAYIGGTGAALADSAALAEGLTSLLGAGAAVANSVAAGDVVWSAASPGTAIANSIAFGSMTGTHATVGTATANSVAAGVFVPPVTGTGIAIANSFASGISPTPSAAVGTATANSVAAGVGENAITAATFRQARAASGVGVPDTHTVTWTVPTVAGNTLFAIMATRAATGITPPAGWLTAVFLNPGGSVGNLVIYYYPNAPSRSGAETFVLGSSASAWGLQLLEFSDVSHTAPLDQGASASSVVGSTILSSGTTLAIAQKYELAIAAWFADFSSGFLTPTAGFSLDPGISVPGGAWMSYGVKNLSVKAIVGTTVHTPFSSPWIGLVATFKLP